MQGSAEVTVGGASRGSAVRRTGNPMGRSGRQWERNIGGREYSVGARRGGSWAAEHYGEAKERERKKISNNEEENRER